MKMTADRSGPNLDITKEHHHGTIVDRSGEIRTSAVAFNPAQTEKL
jgi:hypothetical protein